MSFTTDKQQLHGHIDLNKTTADALIGVKNVVAQLEIRAEGHAPWKHKCFDFVGFEIPDNTEYPDSIAPIGSEYKRFILTDGVVTGCMKYLKTAADTWTEMGEVT